MYNMIRSGCLFFSFFSIMWERKGFILCLATFPFGLDFIRAGGLPLLLGEEKHQIQDLLK